MKKFMLSVLTVFAAASLALAGGPGLRLGSLDGSGKMAPSDVKTIRSLELVSAENGQSVAGFDIEVFKAGKLFSRATIAGAELHEEMRVVLSRLKTGDRIEIKNVSVKDKTGSTTRLADGLRVDVL